MAWWRRREPALTEGQRAALKALVAEAKFELIPMRSAIEKADALPPRSTVTVTASPTHGIESTFDLAEALAARGHDVVPHLSAHMICDRGHLGELLARARAAGFHRVFVVGGDATETGLFPDALALLRAMDELGHPFDEIGVAAYPDGHVAIADDVLLRALKDKQPLAHYMTTQMCFEPAKVASWVTRMRGEGITLPVHLGTPGVAELTKLVSIAARIGVGDSARYLKKNRKMVGALMKPGSFGPDAFLRSLAATLADDRARVEAVHVFTFNQVQATVAWQQRMLESLGAAP